MHDRSFNTWDWQREIHRRCGAAGVGFEFDPKAVTAYTNGSMIYVPTPPEKATQHDYELLRGQVVHECGHIARPDCFKIVKDRGLTNDHPLFMVFNQLEDRIQEHAACDGLVGDMMMIDQLHHDANNQFIRDSATWEFKSELSRSLTTRLGVSLMIALESAYDWMPRAASNHEAVLDAQDRTFGPEARVLYNDLKSEGWVERIKDVRGKPVEDVYALSEQLYQRLFPELPPPPPPGAGKGKASGGKPGDEEGKDEFQEAMATIPWQHLLRSRHEDANEDEVGNCPSTIDWTGKPRNQEPPVWFDRVTVEPPRNVVPTSTPPATPVALLGEVRRELQAKTKVKVTREKLHGRLDRRNLTRLVIPQVGDGTYNRSVFQQLSPGLKLDTAVTILVDCSGSMKGPKYTAATLAALCLYDLCGLALRVPCEVLGFTHVGTGPIVHVFKSYKEPRVRREDLYARLVAGGRSMIGNSDGDALMVAYSRIRVQRNPRKLIIVLSDGSPAEAGNGDPDATLRAAISEIRSKGVELYGIGIMDENVRRFYSKTAPVVSKPGEVADALLKVLRDVLQRQGDSHVSS